MNPAAITDLTPTLTFVITCCTLLTIIAGFTVGMFNRFRKNMANDTRVIIQQENVPLIKSQDDMKKQIGSLKEGVDAATELATKVHSDLNGKDGLFARISYIEAVNGVKRLEPVGTVHPEAGGAD